MDRRPGTHKRPRIGDCGLILVWLLLLAALPLRALAVDGHESTGVPSAGPETSGTLPPGLHWLVGGGETGQPAPDGPGPSFLGASEGVALAGMWIT